MPVFESPEPLNKLPLMERDFVDTIKIKNLEMKRLSWLTKAGPNLITLVPKSRENNNNKKNMSKKCNLRKTWPTIIVFESVGRGPGARE